MRSDGPRLSIVVVAYDIARELPRTLRSLSVGYQRDVTAEDYEVIVVDNGSSPPIDEAELRDQPGQFRLLRVEDASPSPVPAINLGLRAARGEVIGAMLDGARLVSPGLVRLVLAGSQVHPRTGIVTLGWYLGYDFQRYALDAAWTKADEDRLLEGIGWPADGYRLFEVSTLDESSVDGWFGPVVESNALFLPAEVWRELGGFDERFTMPGGGLVNHDALRRAAELEGLRWVVLLGEGTFHQLHGGIATNVTPAEIDDSMARWAHEYETIRGHEVHAPFLRDPVFLGAIPDGLRPRYGHALNNVLHEEALLRAPVPPPVAPLDLSADPDSLSSRWLRLATKAAERGLDVEAMTFARWGREASDEPSTGGPLLAYLAVNKRIEDLPPARRAQFHVDVAETFEAAGRLDEAEAQFREALEVEPGNNKAYLGLSRIRMPGPFYYDHLARLHEELKPATYLEIGVAEGVSLSLARPPTLAVAVDPAPAINQPVAVECRLFVETSADFFARPDVRGLFGGEGPSVAFIDGLHQYPAVLEDFLNVEAIADPSTIIVLHDMIPFDEVTQRPDRAYNFYTGDVWKLLHCLADVRPDLSWFTVRTPPSGLTFVSGLDPCSTLLRDRYDELVDRYVSRSFDPTTPPPGLVLENDWRLVAERLREWQATPAARRASSPGARPAGLGAAARDADREYEGPRGSEAGPEYGPAELGELQIRVSQLRDTRLALDKARAELEAIRRTKVFRWSRGARALYGRLLRRHDGT
jgi:hypothetical protein